MGFQAQSKDVWRRKRARGATARRGRAPAAPRCRPAPCAGRDPPRETHPASRARASPDSARSRDRRRGAPRAPPAGAPARDRVEREHAALEYACDEAQGGRAARRQAQRRQLIGGPAGDSGRRREEPRQLGMRRRDRLAKPTAEPAGERARRRQADLLPEHRARRRLERIERPGDTQPGARAHVRGQARIAREVGGNRRGLGVEIEEPPQPRHHGHERARERRRDRGPQRRALGIGRHRQPAACAADGGGPQVDAVPHQLDAGDRARREVAQHRGPVERRTVLQGDCQRLARGRTVAHAPPHRRRRTAVAQLHGGIEPPHAAEAAGERHLGHRQRRVDDQLPRQRQPPRLGERERADAQLGAHRAAEVAPGDAQPARQRVDGAVVRQRALVDATHGRRDHARQRVDRRRPGGQLRAAAEAGAEPGLLRLRGGAKEQAAIAPRCPRPADGAAVDPGRLHADEEQPVEARIPGQERPVADVGIERRHALTMPRSRETRRPFSDLAATSSRRGPTVHEDAVPNDPRVPG